MTSYNVGGKNGEKKKSNGACFCMALSGFVEISSTVYLSATVVIGSVIPCVTCI
jgi:hypothetical protein